MRILLVTNTSYSETEVYDISTNEKRSKAFTAVVLKEYGDERGYSLFSFDEGGSEYLKLRGHYLALQEAGADAWKLRGPHGDASLAEHITHFAEEFDPGGLITFERRDLKVVEEISAI